MDTERFVGERVLVEVEIIEITETAGGVEYLVKGKTSGFGMTVFPEEIK